LKYLIADMVGVTKTWVGKLTKSRRVLPACVGFKIKQSEVAFPDRLNFYPIQHKCGLGYDFDDAW